MKNNKAEVNNIINNLIVDYLYNNLKLKNDGNIIINTSNCILFVNYPEIIILINKIFGFIPSNFTELIYKTIIKINNGK